MAPKGVATATALVAEAVTEQPQLEPQFSGQALAARSSKSAASPWPQRRTATLSDETPPKK